MGVSSLHVTFPSGEEWAALGAMGFQQRKGLQFHWWAARTPPACHGSRAARHDGGAVARCARLLTCCPMLTCMLCCAVCCCAVCWLALHASRCLLPRRENNGYASFECFLADLKQSKRKSIRQARTRLLLCRAVRPARRCAVLCWLSLSAAAPSSHHPPCPACLHAPPHCCLPPHPASTHQERKGVAKQGLTVKRLTGREVTPELWDAFHGFYLNTVERRWGSAYLTRDFWHM